MTVSELKKYLDNFNDDDIVVMSKDSEGNYFSPLSDVSEGLYDADSTYNGEFYCDSNIEEDDEWEYEGTNSVCLWPIN